MSIVPGGRLGHYEIRAKLGEGGMGAVFRAHDPRLGRDVALKVLPAGMAADPARLERFRREARAIAALNHPHIVTIYSTEEADGIRFLTMELVDGQSLDALIPSGGLPIARFLEIALALADALTAAHQKQITHRDLKPANVMVAADGRVKVLDFGLASAPLTNGGREVERDAGRDSSPALRDHGIRDDRLGGDRFDPANLATSPQITTPGTVIGTMPYMSPEQVEGKPLDHRTDLFSLGVMFHEMLTGSRPFAGDSSAQLMSSILRDVAPRASDIRGDVPEELSRIVHRCLEKRVADRLPGAGDLFTALKHIQRELESGAARRPDSGPATARTRSGLTLVVLPMTSRAGDGNAAALAEGLTDDVTTGLSRFAHLRVISREAAARGADRAGGSLLAAPGGVRYRLEGGVRTSGSAVRVSVRLIDTESGANLWADHIDRSAEMGTFALQDEVASRIVATVGDPTGVLAQAMAAALADVPADRLSVAELVIRFHAYARHFRPEEHARLRDAFEGALQREPRAAEGWGCLSELYQHEHSMRLNPLPDPLGRQRRAAERAIEIDPNSQQSWLSMASGHAFARDLTALRGAIDRVLSINPLNADAVAVSGLYLSAAGEHSRAVALIRTALAHKPQHPGWYHFPLFTAHYQAGDYEAALGEAKLINMPQLPVASLSTAAAAGQLGRAVEAQPALDALRRIDPHLLDPARARELWSVWNWDSVLVDDLVQGLAKAAASAHAPERPASTPAASRSSESSAGHGADAFVVTVLPFASGTGGGDASELADGLSQGVAVGLSRFSYLRVVRRSGTSENVASGFVLSGSVRMAGGVVRVVTQLTEASTGQSLWAETYDRHPGAASIFDLQDELTEKIVATIADVNGALVRALAAAVRAKPAEALSPYEAVVRALAYFSLLSPEEHAELRTALERAVERAPNYADAWGALAFAFSEEHAQGYNARSQAIERAQGAVRRALELDSSNQFAYFTLGRLAFLARDRSALRATTDRLIALNPLAPHIISFLGMATAYTGDWEAGLALCKRAMTLNPHHSGVYWMPFVLDAYRRRDYPGALEILDRVNMPSFPMTSMARAAIYAQLGRLDDALTVWREADARMPGYATRIHDELTKWFAPELVAQIEDAVVKIRRHDEAPSSSPARRPASAVGAGASVAVLPFADLSAEKNQDWFCDGIAEEILNALTQLPGLRVAARTSAFSFRDRGGDLRGIAEKLGVATVLQGSVRRAGDRIRVTVQLVDLGNGFQIWSDRYDRDLKDIFDVQDEIARTVADRLKVTLVGGTDERLITKVTTNLQSYELLLKGRKLLFRRGAAILDARTCFEQAVSLDPNLAEAHALLGDSYRLLGLYGMAPTSDVMPRARVAVERALAIDPQQVEALATLANISAVYDWNVKAALEQSDRALASDPRHIRALAERAIIITKLETPPPDVVAGAMASVRRARELDPLSAWVTAVEAFCLHLANRSADAAAAAHQAAALDPENFTARWVLVWTLSAAGRHDEALAAAEHPLAKSGLRILTEVAAIHGMRGDHAAADAVYQALVARAQTGFVGFAERGAAAASAGRMAEALDLVRQALAARDSYLSFWKLPAWTPFLQNPEGAALLRGAPFMRLAESGT